MSTSAPRRALVRPNAPLGRPKPTRRATARRSRYARRLRGAMNRLELLQSLEAVRGRAVRRARDPGRACRVAFNPRRHGPDGGGRARGTRSSSSSPAGSWSTSAPPRCARRSPRSAPVEILGETCLFRRTVVRSARVAAIEPGIVIRLGIGELDTLSQSGEPVATPHRARCAAHAHGPDRAKSRAHRGGPGGAGATAASKGIFQRLRQLVGLGA